MKTFLAVAIYASGLAAAMASPMFGPHGGAPHAAHGSYHNVPASYSYQYGVKDEYSGVNFGQSEKRDGYSTSGQYHVALPDGRIQTVTYTVADEHSGYVADVQYSGTPHYGPAPHKAALHAGPHHLG